MKALAVDSLTKRYGSVRAVEDVTFHIERGEVFGYLGPNGSGKTTTIRCLMGFLRPTAGVCEVLGKRIIHGRATQHRRIGYLPGDFQIWPGRRGRKSLDLLGALGQSPKLRSTQRALAERLEVDLDRRVGTLSKGNRQKIGVISAFQHQPDLLILDEPTSGLDPLMRQIVMELIREATAGGASVLLSSHDLSEVSAVCERAAILREGRLVEVAPISEIVQRGERRLKVWFGEGDRPPAGLPGSLTGARIIERSGNLLEIAYQGRASAVIQWLAPYDVDRIATPQTSLEEAFMQYYQGKKHRD